MISPVHGDPHRDSDALKARNEAPPSGLLAGKVAIVTGAGKGIGRAEAIELAAHGAEVVVNDNGSTITGEGEDTNVADNVVAEIRERGGSAVSSHDDVSTWSGAENAVQTALSSFGRLDVLVNNAGNYRSHHILELSEDDWDAVIRVHLKGHFAMTHHAAQYWRKEFDAGRARPASIINTVSRGALPPHLRASANYAAAKAGIAALTTVSHLQLQHLGVRVNAIAPSGLTRMIANAVSGESDVPNREYREFDTADPANNAPLVVWLACDDSISMGGQVLRVRGDTIQLLLPWSDGPVATTSAKWDVADISDAVYGTLFKLRPARVDLLASLASPMVRDPADC